MKHISMRDFLERVQKGTVPLLIDIREPYEWDEGHIDGAIHIPMGELGQKIQQVVPDKETEFIVYCASGGRSRRAVDALQAAGYVHALNLEGGFFVYEMHTL